MADEENAVEGEAAPPAGNKKKLIMLAGGAVLLLAIGVFAGLAIMQASAPAEDAVVEEKVPPPKAGPALYLSLHPPLVVNFQDVVGDTHFMQITMEVMSRDQAVIDSVRQHVAVVRNSLILLYSGAVYEDVTTREGKEKMLADGLAEIQKVMRDTAGVSGIEAVYFTALVIQ